MLKFLTMAALFFSIALVGIIAFYAIVTVGILLGEFFDDIERKYGFKGTVISFLIGLAITSVVVAAILTIVGV